MFTSTRLLPRAAVMSFVILVFFSCKKADSPGDKTEAVNWDIYSNYPQDKSYSGAQIAAFNGKVFFSSFGQNGIQPGSSGFLHDLKGSFFYPIGADKYVYSSSNEAITNLKVFNNELYGITERMIPFMNGAVKSYKHSYFLFKWVNDNFQNLDTLEYTNLHHQENAPLANTILWEFGGKLHLVAGTAGATKIWAVTNNQLVEQTTTESYGTGPYLAIDNEGFSFTSYRQTISTQTYLEEEVRTNYFDGTSLTRGPIHVFFEEDGNPASNKHLFYSAIKSDLYGYKNNQLRNFDQDKTVAELTDDKRFRTEGGYIIGKSGKLYSIIHDMESQCRELGIYDGKNFRRLQYQLPEILDPCSKLMDAVENNGTIYLLLLNRGQYVVVYNK